jgi:hypothetical protein
VFGMPLLLSIHGLFSFSFVAVLKTMNQVRCERNCCASKLVDLHLPLRLLRMIDSKATIVILLLNFDFYGKSEREVWNASPKFRSCKQRIAGSIFLNCRRLLVQERFFFAES